MQMTAEQLARTCAANVNLWEKYMGEDAPANFERRVYAMHCFECVDFFGDELSDDAQDKIAGNLFAYLLGLITYDELEQQLVIAVNCDPITIAEFHRFSCDYIKQQRSK